MPVAGESGNDLYTKLLLHFGELDGEWVTWDSALGASVTERIGTINGAGEIDTAQKKFGGGSLLLNGTTDYLSLTNNEDFQLYGQRFTIDFWVRWTDVLADYGAFFSQDASSSEVFHLQWNGPQDILQLYGFWSGFQYIDFSADVGNLNNDQWYHIAVIRGWGDNDDGWAICLDGVMVDSGTNSNDLPYISAPFEIGRKTLGTDAYHGGWIDEFRITKGKTLWTENFDPPTAAARSYHTDNQLSLLLHANELNADLMTYDSSDSESGKGVSTYGTAIYDSEVKKFGVSSVFLDGDLDWMAVSDSPDFYFGTDPFTIDLWIRLSDLASQAGGLIGQWEGNSEYMSFDIYFPSAGQRELRFLFEGSADYITLIYDWADGGTVDPVEAEKWYHVAVVRGWGGTANDFAMLIDGVVVASDTDSIDLTNHTGALTIGASFIGSGGSEVYLDGWMDEVRITKGIALWEAEFIPPTTPTRATKYTSLLMHMNGEDGDNTFYDSVGHTATRIANAQVDSTEHYFAPCSLQFDGSLDAFTFDDDSRFDFGARPFTIDFWVKFDTYAEKHNPFIGCYEDNDNYWYVGYEHLTPDPVGQNHIIFYSRETGGTRASILEEWTYNPTGWNHICIIRGYNGNINTMAILVNGNLLGTESQSEEVPNISGVLTVGKGYDGFAQLYLDGWIDELRVVIGDARWITEFSPPTRPYPDDPLQAYFNVNAVQNPAEVSGVPTPLIATINSIGPS